jgi:hypothetical protein
MFSSSSLTKNFILETDGYPSVFNKKSTRSLDHFRIRWEAEFRYTFHMVGHRIFHLNTGTVPFSPLGQRISKFFLFPLTMVLDYTLFSLFRLVVGSPADRAGLRYHHIHSSSSSYCQNFVYYLSAFLTYWLDFRQILKMHIHEILQILGSKL